MIPLTEIEAARERIDGAAVRTPLVRLYADDAPAEIYLKLELLQPISSFKIRGATNAIRLAPPERVQQGLVTASAGNMAQGVAWAARELGVPATIAVPEHAPEAKLAAIARLGGRVLKLPYDDWWNVIVTSRVEGVDGLFVHPVQDEGVMAGNGTIGLEILEDLPDADAVVIPYGGGGLTVGIASAIKALRPQTKIYRRRARDGRRPARRARGRRPRPRSITSPRSSTGPAAAACSTRCGRGCRPLVDAACRSRSRRRRGRARDRRARARDRRGRRGPRHGGGARRAKRAAGRSSASSRAGTSTRPRWPRS